MLTITTPYCHYSHAHYHHTLLSSQAGGQLTDLLHLPQYQATCDPPCGDGQCCTTVDIAVVSRKRAAVLGSDQLVGSPLVRHVCQDMKHQGDTCLLRNNRNEWCNCTVGLACTFSDTAFLNNFFGVCQ